MLSGLRHNINTHYGSLRGCFNSLKYDSLLKLGGYRQHRKIDFNRVQRLVFICSGNICRSPLGEAIAKIQGANAESYGLHCRGGDGADPRAIQFAATAGADLSRHITRNIALYEPCNEDLLVVMEPLHIRMLPPHLPGVAGVTLAGLWLLSPKLYLHDPFNCAEAFFNRCETEVAAAAKALAKHVV